MRRRFAFPIVAAATIVMSPSPRGGADPAAVCGPAAGSEFDRPHAGFVPGRAEGPF